MKQMLVRTALSPIEGLKRSPILRKHLRRLPVRTALSPIEGLKLFGYFSGGTAIAALRQNSAKPD